MSYEDFITDASSYTKNVILKAIDIYSLMEKRDFICNSYSVLNELKKERINNVDKKYASLFLASLLIDGPIKKNMNDGNITSEKVLKYFGLELREIDSVNDECHKKYFEEDFKLILLKLGTTQNRKINISDEFFLEAVICNLSWNTICGSKIIESIFKDILTDKPMFVWEYVSFSMLKELVEQKYPSSGKNKKRDVSKSSSDESPLFEENDVYEEILRRYGEFLTERKYKTNPAVGREKELRVLMTVLFTPEKSPIIVGEAGIGKTAIVDGLSYLIQNRNVPKLLQGAKIVKMNTSAILSGCMYVGMFEERVEGILKALKELKNTILFIDEIHNVIGAGSSSKKDMDLANILKPYLDRGQIKLIGATTSEEYDEYIKRDSAFKRRFEKVDVYEPDELSLTKILDVAISKIEGLMGINFAFNEEEKDIIIQNIVECTRKNHRVYNDNVNNPDLSLSILGKAFAIAVMDSCDTVKIEHVAEAIEICQRINEVSRTEKSRKLLEIFEKLNGSTTANSKILAFPGYENKSN